jgi:hypothetical protein
MCRAMYCTLSPDLYTSSPSLSGLLYIYSQSTPFAFTTHVHRAALFVCATISRSPGDGPFTSSAAHILLGSRALPLRRNFSDLNTYANPTCWLHSLARRLDIYATVSRTTCFLNNRVPRNPLPRCLAFIPNLLQREL